MDNVEALALLDAKRTAINRAINKLNEYRSHHADWKTEVERVRHGGVVDAAAFAGVDLTDWES